MKQFIRPVGTPKIREELEKIGYDAANGNPIVQSRQLRTTLLADLKDELETIHGGVVDWKSLGDPDPAFLTTLADRFIRISDFFPCRPVETGPQTHAAPHGQPGQLLCMVDDHDQYVLNISFLALLYVL